MSVEATSTAGPWTTRPRRPRARKGAAGVRPGLLGGVDVRPVCGPTRRIRTSTARRWGGIVRFGGRGEAGGAVGVRIAGQFRLHGPGVGLQSTGGRGGAGSEPSRAAADPDWACGRQVSTLGLRMVCSVRGRVQRFGAGRRRAAYGRPGIWMARKSRRCEVEAGPSSLQSRRASRLPIPEPCGSRLLAVGREQHEPCGLRGVSGAISERGVQRARSLRRRRFAARNGSSAHDLSHVSGQRRRSAARGRFSVVGGQRAKFGPRGPQGPPETATRVDLSPLRAS